MFFPDISGDVFGACPAGGPHVAGPEAYRLPGNDHIWFVPRPDGRGHWLPDETFVDADRGAEIRVDEITGDRRSATVSLTLR